MKAAAEAPERKSTTTTTTATATSTTTPTARGGFSSIRVSVSSDDNYRGSTGSRQSFLAASRMFVSSSLPHRPTTWTNSQGVCRVVLCVFVCVCAIAGRIGQTAGQGGRLGSEPTCRQRPRPFRLRPRRCRRRRRPRPRSTSPRPPPVHRRWASQRATTRPLSEATPGTPHTHPHTTHARATHHGPDLFACSMQPCGHERQRARQQRPAGSRRHHHHHVNPTQPQETPLIYHG